MESKSSASRTLVWPVSALGRSVSVMIPPSVWVAVDIPGRLAKAWHVPGPPDPGQGWSRGRARDHGASVAQSHTHGKFLSPAPRGTKHMGPCPVIWKPGGDRVTVVRRLPAPGIRTGL